MQVAGDVAITVAADVYDSSPIDPDDISDVGVDGEDLTVAGARRRR